MINAFISRYGWIGNPEYAGARSDEYYVRCADGTLAAFGREELKVIAQR